MEAQQLDAFKAQSRGQQTTAVVRRTRYKSPAVLTRNMAVGASRAAGRLARSLSCGCLSRSGIRTRSPGSPERRDIKPLHLSADCTESPASLLNTRGVKLFKAKQQLQASSDGIVRANTSPAGWECARPQSQSLQSSSDTLHPRARANTSPVGWECAWSQEHGQTYYFNRQTGDSSWTKPSSEGRVEGRTFQGGDKVWVSDRGEGVLQQVGDEYADGKYTQYATVKWESGREDQIEASKLRFLDEAQLQLQASRGQVRGRSLKENTTFAERVSAQSGNRNGMTSAAVNPDAWHKPDASDVVPTKLQPDASDVVSLGPGNSSETRVPDASDVVPTKLQPDASDVVSLGPGNSSETASQGSWELQQKLSERDARIEQLEKELAGRVVEAPGSRNLDGANNDATCLKDEPGSRDAHRANSDATPTPAPAPAPPAASQAKGKGKGKGKGKAPGKPGGEAHQEKPTRPMPGWKGPLVPGLHADRATSLKPNRSLALFQGSIYEQLYEEDDFRTFPEDWLQLIARNRSTATSATPPATPRSRKGSFVQVIEEPGKSKNIGMLHATLKRRGAGAVKELQWLIGGSGGEKLSVDTLESLCDMLSYITPDEEERINNTGSDVELVPQESFLRDLRKEAGALGAIKERVVLILRMERFDDAAEHLENLMSQGSAACSIRACSEVPLLLKGVLTVGNIVHAASSRKGIGDFVAVSLDSVAKFAETKYQDPETSERSNALKGLVKQLELEHPGFRAKLIASLQACKALDPNDGKGIDPKDIQEGIQTGKGLDTAGSLNDLLDLVACLRTVQQNPSSDPPEALQPARVLEFVATADSRLHVLQKQMTQFNNEIAAMRTFFAEPPGTTFKDMLRSLSALRDALS